MMTTNLLVFVSLIRSYSATKMSKKQMEIVLALNNRLGLKQCIFIGCGDISNVKEMAKARIFSTVTTIRKFEELDQKISSSFSPRKLMVEIITDEQNKLSKASSHFFRLIIDEIGRIKKENLTSIEGKIYLVRSRSEGFWISEIFHGKILFEEYYFSENGIVAEAGDNWGKNGKTNLDGYPLMVAKHSDKWCYRYPMNHCEKANCIQNYIIKLIAIRLNFTELEFECPDKCLDRFPTKSYCGLIEKLIQGQVDISARFFMIDPAKNMSNRFHYIWPTYILKFNMYVKKREFKDHWDSYFRPFEPENWFAILIMISISGLIFFLLRLSSLKFNGKGRQNIYLSYCILDTLGIFCNQAGTESINSISIRIYRLTILLLALILYAVYNALLLFSLALYDPGLPFLDSSGFFLNGKYKIIAIHDSILPSYFQNEFVPPKNMRMQDFVIESKKLPTSTEDGINQLCIKPNWGYMGMREYVSALNNFKCEIVEIPSPFIVFYLGFGLPLNSPYRDDINRELTYLRSNGLLQKIYFDFKIIEHGKLRCSKNDDFSVDFSTCLPILAGFAFGVLVSFCIFLGEMMTKKLFSVSISSILQSTKFVVLKSKKNPSQGNESNILRK